jgi:hypothetical protein
VTYGNLLAFLTTLTNGELEKNSAVMVAGQCLVVNRLDEGDGDDPPILDTGINYSR